MGFVFEKESFIEYKEEEMGQCYWLKGDFYKFIRIGSNQFYS